jgi:N4-gp56 family major capsid protein
MATNTFTSNFSSDAVSAYIAAKILLLAEKRLVLYQLCDKAGMKYGEGRTFQYTRYDRVDLPQAVLSEGVTPGDSAMSISTVSAVMDQWGAVIPISDVAIDSVKHPVLQQAIRLASLQASESVDREIYKVLITGTNVFFPNAISARGSLTSSDKLASAVVGKVVANMRDDGAMGYDGDMYVGVVDPFGEDDLVNDATFVLAAQYGNQKKLFVNEIGSWKGVRWVRSNSYPAIQLLGAVVAASSATAGSLTASTTYNGKLAVVDKKTGHETFISATFNAATDVGETSVDITIPALPAGATAGSLFRLYFGTNGGTLYLAANDIAASSTYNQKTVPTSGAVAQAAPPSGIPVHISFVLGKEGVACVELNKIKSYLTPAVASDSDPLVQRRKVGWKCDFKAVITNELFLSRIEHACTNN